MAILAFNSDNILDATVVGKAVLTASSEGIAADAIGLGSTDSVTFSSVTAVDGSYSGSLNIESGGSQKLYNLGAEGDTDTEYLEASTTGTAFNLLPKQTGAGVVRSLTVGSGLAGTTYNISGSQTTFFAANGLKMSITNGGTYLNDDIFPNNTGVQTCGNTTRRWGNVASVDGSFSGNLNIESGGSQKLYNLGTEGDTDTEYFETSFDTNVAVIGTAKTGTGTGRNLELRHGGATILSVYSSRIDTNKDFRPTNNNAVSCGSVTKRWYGMYSVRGDFSGDVIMAGDVNFSNLPTSDPGVPGQVYVTTGGALKVSQ